MIIKIEIQTAYSDKFIAIVDKDYFELKLDNIDLGREKFVDIITTKGMGVKLNPEYVAYIKYLEVIEE